MSQITATSLNVDQIDSTSDNGINMSGESLRNHRDKVQIPAISAGVLDIEYSDGGMVIVNLTEDITTFSFSNFTAGGSMLVYFVQDATGGRSVTFPSNMVTNNGEGIEMSSGGDEYDIMSFISKDGVNIDVIQAGINFS